MFRAPHIIGTSERSNAAEDLGKRSVLGSPLRVLFLSILTHNEGAVSRPNPEPGGGLRRIWKQLVPFPQASQACPEAGVSLPGIRVRRPPG